MSPLDDVPGDAPAESDASAGRGRVIEIAERIAHEVSGPAAAAVDAEARFPVESVEAFKRERLLSALVPVERGGLGATVAELADAVRTISKKCTSSALVLAMHSIEVYNLLRYGDTPWLRGLLARVVDEQILFANGTSQRVGPDGGASLIDDGGVLRIDRPTVACSYGLEADAIFTNMRRSPEADPDDQVYLAVLATQSELELTTTWDTLGLRGTCSYGMRILAKVDHGAVFPTGAPAVLGNGGIQVRHLLAGAAYVGLAEAALREAHAVVRAEARRSGGVAPKSAIRLAELLLEVEKARGLVAMAAARFERLEAASKLDDLSFIVSLRNLKVASTAIAVETAMKALQICGIDGIRKDGSIAIERIIRDAHAALVMFGNDGLLRDNASTLAIRKSI
ncbi:acyl-CoA dehydrogenase family protein [Lysinimonas soli]|uniref:Acyl-CoA dehydrogenase family protein n=1 Tax=Lysinimonas soli TaxID=1074233 RepID=A0ABW0NNS4_9MICO